VTQLAPASNVKRIERCPGKLYMSALESNFENTNPDSQASFLQELKNGTGVQIEASPEVATSVALVHGAPHVFMANFAGLHGGVNPVQTVQTGIRITVPSKTQGRAYFLPFMGEVQEVQGVSRDGRTSFTLPPISKGAAFWYEPASDHKSDDKTN
jgi:hypothetical protein